MTKCVWQRCTYSTLMLSSVIYPDVSNVEVSVQCGLNPCLNISALANCVLSEMDKYWQWMYN